MADFSQEQALPLRNIHPCLVTSPQPCFSTPSSQSWSPPPPACGTPTLKQTTPRKTRTTTGVAYGPDRPNPSTSPPDSNCHPLTIREGSSSNPNCNARPLHRSWLRNRRFRFRRFGGTVGLCLSLSLHLSLFLGKSNYLTTQRLDEFRVALLSYATPERIYASSKSRWTDFSEALELVMEKCVRQGTGGAYLVPRKLPPSISRKRNEKK